MDEGAVMIGGGGEFVSYAGKYLEPRRHGAWLSPCMYVGVRLIAGIDDRRLSVGAADGVAGLIAAPPEDEMDVPGRVSLTYLSSSSGPMIFGKKVLP